MFDDYYKQSDKYAEDHRDGFQTVGDIAYRDDEGYLYICDRKRDMIISGGVNIYPAEIEAALELHPDIYEAAVFGIPSEEWGEAVHAVVVARPGSALDDSRDEAVVADHARQHLAGFKVPRSISWLEELPKTGSGKILKRELRARVLGRRAAQRVNERAFRSGFVTMVGRPNVGKSSLVNAICGAKVSIVSDKPQTTRHRVRGVYNRPDAQLVFVDTPGLHKPVTALGEKVNATALESLGEADDVDVVCLVLDATAPFGAGDRWVAERDRRRAAPWSSSTRRIGPRPTRSSPCSAQPAELEAESYFPVSARTGDGLDALRRPPRRRALRTVRRCSPPTRCATSPRRCGSPSWCASSSSP